ncbi:MAG: epoxide hydrolase [Rhodobacteraceae bacterium]|nr:epoxide hydrolase [Paracoccaceae bacterium]
MRATPFTLQVPDADIEDLKARLARTRLPDQPPGPAWQSGTDLDYLRDLVGYWRDGFDWRAQEAALNAFPQFKIPLHDIDLHFIHAEGKGPNPMPLLLLHGWPGSVFEFLDILPRLTDPAAFGGDPADAFTVVAPSLPGYGLSFAPGQRRFSVQEMADCFADLMPALGYEHFGVQGGDWGGFTGSAMGLRHPERLIGLHQNLIAIRPDPTPVPDATPEEARYAEEIGVWVNEESGYTWIQATRPQTLAYGVTDSPAGLAGWIVEKFHAWTDNDGTPESAVDRDRMLANISLYWFTGAIGSSFWPYYARHRGEWPVPDGAKVTVPFGYAAFPCEIRRPPRSIAERAYTDIRRWTEMEKGGHFAAMEQPEALAGEIREFFRALR